MRARTFFLVAALAAGACGDNVAPPAQDDAAPPVVDAANNPDAGTPVRGPCLDRPTDLPRPPVGELPCDLYPPGFGASP
jgi:hypothetical protein